MSINRRNFLKGSLLGAGVALTGFTGCTSTNKSEVEAVVKECVEKGKNRKQLLPVFSISKRLKSEDCVISGKKR